MIYKRQTIFVFGSNLAGRHGAGAAKYAYNFYDAEYGVGNGRTGNAYAIPTKDNNLQTRSIDDIAESICSFIEYALEHPELTFKVTRIGCGLAGYKDKDIAPLFDPPPRNCLMPNEWKSFYTP